MEAWRAAVKLRHLLIASNAVRNHWRSLSLTAKYPTLSSSSTESEESGRETHFGFKTVSEDEKQEKVDSVFTNVAEKYDLMNDVMSGGVHRLWKDYFVSRLGPTPGSKILDVAGGTGDIAFRILKYANNESETGVSDDIDDISVPRELQFQAQSFINPDTEDVVTPPAPKLTEVTVCDINQSMLDVGMKRARAFGLSKQLNWLQSNAEHLEAVPDNTYDAYTIAYGIRNCTHIDRVISEAYRVLKPGGRFMCLEFSQVNNAVLRMIYDEYSFQVIPVMGKIVAGDWDSYQYLVESIRQFPPQEEFKDMIRAAGFKFVTFENIFGGVTAIHSGFKLK